MNTSFQWRKCSAQYGLYISHLYSQARSHFPALPKCETAEGGEARDALTGGVGLSAQEQLVSKVRLPFCCQPASAANPEAEETHLVDFGDMDEAGASFCYEQQDRGKVLKVNLNIWTVSLYILRYYSYSQKTQLVMFTTTESAYSVNNTPKCFLIVWSI